MPCPRGWTPSPSPLLCLGVPDALTQMGALTLGTCGQGRGLLLPRAGLGLECLHSLFARRGAVPGLCWGAPPLALGPKPS